MGFLAWHLVGVTWWAFSLFMVWVIIAGMCIGGIGLGGVLLMPGLLILGADPHTSTASCMMAYVLPGAIGTFIYYRSGSIRLRRAIFVGAGIVPGAGVGPLLVSVTPGPALSYIVASVCILSGVQTVVKLCVSMRRKGSDSIPEKKEYGGTASGTDLESTAGTTSAAEEATTRSSLQVGTDVTAAEVVIGGEHPKMAGRRPATAGEGNDAGPSGAVAATEDGGGAGAGSTTLARVCCEWDRYSVLDICIGLVVGVGSTLTATGGPLITIPLTFLFYPHAITTETVGLSQIASVIISISATVGFGLSTKTDIDAGLAGAMAAATCLGVPLGAKMAHKLPQQTLKMVVSWVLIAVGVSVTVQTILRQLEHPPAITANCSSNYSNTSRAGVNPGAACNHTVTSRIS